MKENIIRSVYNFTLMVIRPFSYLYYLLRVCTDGKYKASHRQRMGSELSPFLPEARRIWIHALSVGETLSVVPLVKALREHDPATEILFSTATESGQEIARRHLSQCVGHFFYLPHDFPRITEMTVRRLKPSLFVLVETDIWPNLLRALKQHQVPVVMVNGRFSPRSFERLLRFRSLVAPLFRSFDLVFTQSSQDRERYCLLGVPEDRVFAAGNLKFDLLLPKVSKPERTRLREQTGIGEGRRVWIAGSTHEGEEEVLLQIHKTLRRTYPDLLLIPAPRHVQRAPQIITLCHRYGLSVARRSNHESAQDKAVFLLDTLGELNRFYALADVAFIGGSLVPFGGHNPLEAAAQGKTVLWGPHLFNFREIEAQLTEAGCGRKVNSGEELCDLLIQGLGSCEIRKQAEEATKRFFETHSGCSRKIARQIADTFL